MKKGKHVLFKGKISALYLLPSFVFLFFTLSTSENREVRKKGFVIVDWDREQRVVFSCMLEN
jgi:hypothetical protein